MEDDLAVPQAQLEKAIAAHKEVKTTTTKGPNKRTKINVKDTFGLPVQSDNEGEEAASV